MTGSEELDPQPDPDGPDRQSMLGAFGCTALILPVGAWFWLVARDRTGILGERAHAEGAYGPLISLALGLAYGLVSAWLVGVTSARWSRYRQTEQQIVRRLGRLPEASLAWIALVFAVGEEFMFRLAAQDHLGIGWSLALYALANWMPGMTLWTGTVTLLAVGWSWMVHAGYGLLAAATAHAIFSYLTLRRINPR